jgi:hypothetical protein
MPKVAETWKHSPVQLRAGGWITLAVGQRSDGWHYAWWWRPSFDRDDIDSGVHGASAIALPTREAAERAGIDEAELAAVSGS